MLSSSLFLKDFYKVGHIHQYPKGTSLIFNNFTPRKSLIKGIDHSVFFGLKFFIKYLNHFNDELNYPIFDMPNRYRFFIKNTLGMDINISHIENLIQLRYLPLAIYSLPEKTEVPSGCPAMVMFNTHPDFYWLPNMLETLLSSLVWGPSTSATIANEYRKMLDNYALETSDIPEFVDYQAHDFSMRGMYGIEAAIMSGVAHLQYFKGTDTIPAMLVNEELYGNELHICSVPATEHSVMSAGGKETEYETFDRLITEIYPSGIISIVSDTWDLWNVVSDILPRLKDKIMSRNGKVVIRPDSGDPEEILCGKIGSQLIYESKGLIECLWDIFGGTINSKGYKQLDPHIGAIYGDSITLDRATSICQNLKNKGFASTNIIFGIGSYTYQYNTRDTFGWAVKATYCEIDGVGHAITKDPKTDCGTKKSHSGLLKVIKDSAGHYQLIQNTTWEEFYKSNNELKCIYKNGEHYASVP